ncbi:MAG: hypothetical protein JW838_12520 [Spirochaetes bacterium]|nr:hypothetical protein [Spirochaetota bacterium]
METFITALTSNKIIFTAAVIISILVVLSALKKLIKLALVLLALLVLYSAYVVYSGRRPTVFRMDRSGVMRMAGRLSAGEREDRGFRATPGLTPLPRARI